MKVALKCLLLTASAFLLVNEAFASPCPPGNPPTNCAPPPGWILDLAGGPVPDIPTYNNYTVNFIAGPGTTTNLSFALREDPAFLYLDDVSVTDLTNPSGELVTNGGFESGLTGWTALNTFGAGAAGEVTDVGANAHGGFFVWFDGSIQGYDGLTQILNTTQGDQYHISFFLSDNGPLTTFQQLSTNGNTTDTGGNGIDLLVYAGAIPTIPTIPEPATLALLGIGLAGMGISRRRKLG